MNYKDSDKSGWSWGKGGAEICGCSMSIRRVRAVLNQNLCLSVGKQTPIMYEYLNLYNVFLTLKHLSRKSLKKPIKALNEKQISP